MINRDELLKIAREAGLSYLDGSNRNEFGHFIDDEIYDFANAILERAAVECETDPLGSRGCADLIRALKTQGE